ncbi:hypothetical protein [Nitrosovibrio sp. Nv4]|uniref:hypothetical protein n=1 Tax=Nitrosovibrio sp. Nv4 TaxID=1945880 RepID=UPI000BE2342F|nr:hypothetical protein [Nitrosovibrio sp. Nv4]
MSVPMYSPAKVELDVEEIIALLKKTSLPTVIVEGSDDMIVYRRFEIRLAHLGISIFPVCGRKKVLDIFLRKSEIPADVKLVFVADQDTWVNTGVPAQYQSSQMVLTTGYSIENDVFMDGNLVSLLKGQEVAKFSSELESFVEWYSLALSRHLNGSNHLISLHPDHVLNPVQRPALLALCAGEQYPDALRQQMLVDYQRLLRGKSLIALLVRNTNYKGRQPHHSDRALLEMVAVRPGPLLQLVSSQVEAAITN